MSKVAAITKITATAGRRAELLEALAEVVRATFYEHGTVQYVMHRDTGDDDVIWIYELYADQEAVATHGNSAAVRDTGRKVRGLVGGPPQVHILSPAIAKGVDVD